MKFKIDIEKIETIRVIKGWTKLEFCKICGIRPSVYCKLAHQNVGLTNQNVMKIASVLKVSPLDIITYIIK